jgi:hypothetical protein
VEDWVLYMYCIYHVALDSAGRGTDGKATQHSGRWDHLPPAWQGTSRTVHYGQGIGHMIAKGCRGKRTARAAKGDARLIARNQG